MLSAAALFGAACGGPVTEPTNNAGTDVGQFTPSSRVHMMPYGATAKSGPINTATTAHLTYYGGKVLQNVKVVAVFWGPNVNSTITSGIGGFYTNVTNSAYFDWLSEYNTTSPAQSIGRGTYFGSVTITPGTTGTSLSDSQIQTELNNQINSGVLPAPTANTWYAIYFPAGVSITQGSSSSCVAGGFCAYHGTFNGTKGEIFYGVMPDMAPGSGCNTGCGSDPTWFNNATSVSSHEMIETVTDAEVGLATVVGSPLAWYDSTNGEIGDICNAQQGSIAGYVVQKEWSNSSNACIVSKAVANDFSISASPSSASVTAGGSATYTVSTALTSGSAQTISLSISGLPTGATASFSPTSVSSGGSSTLTVTTSTSTPNGTYTLTITGTGSSATHTTSVSLAVSGGSGGTCATSNLILNPGFESGSTNWTATAGVINNDSTLSHTGSWEAYLNGYGTTHTDTLLQTVTIPSGCTTTTLSFWLHITTAETTTTTAYDTLKVQIRNTSGTVLGTLATYSNLNANSSYAQKSFNVSAYAGQTVQVYFVGSEDSSLQTSFFIDDVSVQ